jgi:hypothetical protein
VSRSDLINGAVMPLHPVYQLTTEPANLPELNYFFLAEDMWTNPGMLAFCRASTGNTNAEDWLGLKDVNHPIPTPPSPPTTNVPATSVAILIGGFSAAIILVMVIRKKRPT